MKSWRTLMVVAILAAAACNANTGDPGRDSGTTTSQDKYAPCTDASTCCSDTERMTCTGDPDNGMVCTCAGLWDCSKNPRKCSQDLPTPPGGTGWECSWGEFKYTCTGSGDKNTNPQNLPGGSNWACVWQDQEFKWVCTTTPPNPTNKPEGAGVWQCQIVTENNKTKLVCDRTDTSTPPTGGGVWDCVDSTGKHASTCPAGDYKCTCTKTDDNNGLPPGGSNWTCNQAVIGGVTTWICYGDSPTGGGGWTCVPVSSEFGKYKCTKEQTQGDTPPGGGWFACEKGTEFGGTKCTQVPNQPTPPTPTSEGACDIGSRMWCDGLEYCGWGQVDCDPATNKWRTKVNDASQTVLDCRESLAGGKRPKGPCACYHFFYNPTCCERPDCIVPDGENGGQICPTSSGALCDYCNPRNSGECKEAGAQCVITNSHETFCGRECSTANPCPTGYTCMVMKLTNSQTSYQCVPADLSCFF